MDIGSNRAFTLAGLSGGALCLAAAWLADQPLLLALAAFFFCLSLLFWRLGWVLAPLLGQAASVRLAGSDWELAPSQDVLLQRSPAGWRASMALGVSLRDSASFAGASQQGLMMELFEKAIGGLRHPLQLSILACPLDVSAHVQKLEERRSLCEHRRARLSGPKQSDEAAKLEREIESYNAQIRRLSSGERPMKVAAWALTSAAGLTREEAVSRVRAQAQESMAVLAGALACSVAPLAGEDFLRALDWQKFAPASTGELEDQAF